MNATLYKERVSEKSRECHNHKPQSIPNTNRKRKQTKPNKRKSNKRTKSTKTSSVFPRTYLSFNYCSTVRVSTCTSVRLLRIRVPAVDGGCVLDACCFPLILFTRYGVTTAKNKQSQTCDRFSNMQLIVQVYGIVFLFVFFFLLFFCCCFFSSFYNKLWLMIKWRCWGILILTTRNTRVK